MSRLLSKGQAQAIVKSLRLSVLPNLEREYVEALDYIVGPKDRGGAAAGKLSDNGEHSDPTGDTVVDQESNVSELRRIGKKIEHLEKDAGAIRSRLKGLFDAGADYGRRTDGHIPSAEEEHQRQQAVRAQAKRALQTEKSQLEKRLKDIERSLGAHASLNH